jgi:hypothetical protein
MNILKSPLSAQEILESSFLENRARILEIAAFLDRIERADGTAAVQKDFRYQAVLHAVGCLLRPSGNRAGDILHSLSDPTTEPIPSAAGMQSAVGAWKGAPHEDH